ncbi:MAG TPA: MFS transporter [Verrucomicrobiae bacterium]|nr:MFS transporter [Verrucomicrobiae bacterium]
MLPQPAGTAPATRARYGVLGFTLLLAAIAYLDRVCISTAAPVMETDLGLNDAQMGYVFSAFTFAYALMEVPSGWLADRFGPRLMLTRIVIWWSVMTAATGWAAGFASLFVIRMLFGVGEAGCFPSMSRAFVRWLPAREHGRAFGLAVMTGALGGAVTQPLVVWMLGRVHWRHTFPIFGTVGLVWAAAWFWWFRDDPHNHQSVNEAELGLIGTPPPAPHERVPWNSLLSNRSVWAVCFMYFGVIYGWYFFLTWMPTYLMRARGFDLKHAGWLSSLPLIGIATGVLCGGLVSDALVRRWGLKAGRRATGLIGPPLAAVCIVAGVRTTNPIAAAWLLALAALLAALAVAPGWAVCLEIGGRHAGVVSGAMNTFGNLGGAISPLVVGEWLQRRGAWDLPLLTVAGCYLLAAVCWLGINPAERLADSFQNRVSSP